MALAVAEERHESRTVDNWPLPRGGLAGNRGVVVGCAQGPPVCGYFAQPGTLSDWNRADRDRTGGLARRQSAKVKNEFFSGQAPGYKYVDSGIGVYAL